MLDQVWNLQFLPQVDIFLYIICIRIHIKEKKRQKENVHHVELQIVESTQKFFIIK